MIGAIAGDVIGSIYEHFNNKSKDFPLFSFNSQFTDDTVMTLAVAEALIRSYPLKDPNEAAFETAECMKKWGNLFPYAGYGGMFMDWLRSSDPKPYNSFGNGSAMRVSSCPWIYRDDFEKMRAVARATAMPTHNHEEGIKGADAVASAIWLALSGKKKDEIKSFIEQEFGYDLSRTLDEIRPDYKMDATCPGSVPEAIIAFLEGNDFEDVIRGAVSIGGDSDTIAAIAGSIAEAYYGIPESVVKEVRERLTPEQNYIVDCFIEFRNGQREEAVLKIQSSADWWLLSLNKNIEHAIDNFNKNRGQETYTQVINAIDYNAKWSKLCVIAEAKDPSGQSWVLAATGIEHVQSEFLKSVKFIYIRELFRQLAARNNVFGILINPWSQRFELPFEAVRGLAESWEEEFTRNGED